MGEANDICTDPTDGCPVKKCSPFWIVYQWLAGYLAEKYGLDIGIREKAVTNVDDLYLVLHPSTGGYWGMAVRPSESIGYEMACLDKLSAEMPPWRRENALRLNAGTKDYG
jgi:hypothetical protein